MNKDNDDRFYNEAFDTYRSGSVPSAEKDRPDLTSAKERRGTPTTLGCSTNSKNLKHTVSKHRTNMHVDAEETRNTKSQRKTLNIKDYT